MRTRIFSKLLNAEVEDYLSRNDIIIIPVGVTELHGGLPLDAETVVSEGIALKIAEKVDGLVLTNLPYFFAGATQAGRGTLEVSVRTGIDYLYEISKQLLKLGFRRQIYTSLHGPANLTIGPVVRDFFTEFKTPICYIDAVPFLMKNMPEILAIEKGDVFSKIIIASYDILGRLQDCPLTSEVGDFSEPMVNAMGPYNKVISKVAIGNGAFGYYFPDYRDHMPTTRIESVEHRQQLADEGKVILDQIVEGMNMEEFVADLRNLDKFQNEEVIPKKEWLRK